METIIGHDFAAKEVRGPRPDWSKAADVYSLGMTLSDLVSAKDPQAALLRERLSPWLADAPEARPSAEELAGVLGELVDLLGVVKTRNDAWSTICSAAGKGKKERWFTGILEKSKEDFGAFALGAHGRTIDRAVRIANFLNQALEAYSLDGRRYTKKLTLGYVKSQNVDTGSKLATLEISFLHELRLYGAHGGEKLATAFQNRARALPAQQVRARVTEGAKQIALLVEQPALEAVVAVLLQMGAEIEGSTKIPASR